MNCDLVGVVFLLATAVFAQNAIEGVNAQMNYDSWGGGDIYMSMLNNYCEKLNIYTQILIDAGGVASDKNKKLNTYTQMLINAGGVASDKNKKLNTYTQILINAGGVASDKNKKLNTYTQILINAGGVASDKKILENDSGEKQNAYVRLFDNYELLESGTVCGAIEIYALRKNIARV